MSVTFQARRITGSADVLAEVARLAGDLVATPFQTADWLEPLYGALSPALEAEPLAIRVDEVDTGTNAMLLPLILRREGALRVASFPDLGVSDYGAPILGPAAPDSAHGAGAMWKCVREALAGADLVRLTSMPALLGPRSNPLALLGCVVPARHSANRLTLEGTVEDMLRARGKKYRKEVERCFRLLEKEGQPSFSRAETTAQVARAFQALESQQQQRREQAGGRYDLALPAYSRFYSDLLARGVPAGSAHIFTLEVGGEIVAVLLGLTHAGAFTLLRISNGGERWHHLSPGRLIVVEAMRHFSARGIATFDMGIGDYAFKRGFGIEPEPLIDLFDAITLRGQAFGALARAKARARQSPTLMAVAGRLRGSRPAA